MELKIKIQVLVELLEFLPLEYLILVELLWGNGIVSPFYIVTWTRSLDGLNMNENIITSLNYDDIEIIFGVQCDIKILYYQPLRLVWIETWRPQHDIRVWYWPEVFDWTSYFS